MGCEHPEWLPAGWKVRVKARSSGKKDKFCAEAEGQMSITDDVDESLSPDEMGNSGLKLATDVKCDATNVAKGQIPISQKADESLSCNEKGKSGSKAALLRTEERRWSPRLAANKLKDGASRDPSLFQTGFETLREEEEDEGI
ncbi:uncharacterized protein LOC127256280 isoform X2 [Andrographis paniculata]|uniref:uncharacterized protein LOC127256280 isoform X2 n=1 Tax=Andrographis paniculata TaxID=175694 RepID=UPI0021E7AAAF|nr:uncharacterized protein LOC127256280 isoform X2 [Andrographis paniculata]